MAQGFGVMDVNIPAHVTKSEDAESFISRPSEQVLQHQIQELVCYLWDNYLQLWDAEDVFLLGVGNAYLGVKVLLTNRDCKSRIRGVVNFVDGNLRPVKSETDPELSSWYKRHSLVYVSCDHACWTDRDLAKKVSKKRFGGVKQSSQATLSRMMEEHAEEAQAWVMERVTLDEEDGDRPENLNVGIKVGDVQP